METTVILVNEGVVVWVWVPPAQPCIGWLVDEAHKSQLYRGSAPSAFNGTYCGW